jgi:hypothetical protein
LIQLNIQNDLGSEIGITVVTLNKCADENDLAEICFYADLVDDDLSSPQRSNLQKILCQDNNIITDIHLDLEDYTGFRKIGPCNTNTSGLKGAENSPLNVEN